MINNIQTENGVSNIMSNLCKQYVENELNCYKKKLYDITNEIHSTEIELKTVDKNLIKLNKEKDWSEDIFHSLISLKQTDNIRLQTLQDSKYELNNKINFLNNQKKDVETKIEELINILRDDDSNVSRETMSDSIHDNVKLIDFIELDRKRISRDIHDSVVQNLTALIHKQEFISQIINTDITRSKLEINNSVVLIKESINELRNIIYELRPMSVDDLGFKNAIMNMIDKFNRENNVITYYSSINFDDELSIDSNLIISILRIINELNSNAIKYSNGTEIIINVTLKDNNVIIEFKDNGKGFDYYNTVYDRNKNSGFGLTMLKERVALLNGNIKYIYDNGSDFFIEIPVW